VLRNSIIHCPELYGVGFCIYNLFVMAIVALPATLK
jgi:acetoin utilization deacetylase AcuC-like enzyme